MRRRLGDLAALAALAAAAPAVLAACGDDTATTTGTVADPPSASTATSGSAGPSADEPDPAPDATAAPPDGVEVIGLHAASAAGGTPGAPVRLATAADVAELGLEGRRGGPLGAELRGAFRDWVDTRPGEGRALAAVVVEVGCAEPVDVAVELDPLEVEAVPRDTGTDGGTAGRECLVPVTTVALVEVPVTALTA